MKENDFATRLNSVMRDKGMTPQMVAIRTGISDRMIRNYQKGAYTPTGYSLKMLAKALGVTADWLLGLEEDAND